MEKATLTRRMDSVLNDLQKEFKALYTKEDFIQELKRLSAAGTQSNRPSILADLYDMLDACGISYEKDRENTYYEKLIKSSNLPDDWVEAEDKMFFALYNQFEEYASAGDYMQRIVDRLRNEEDCWEKDTLRLQILKQFIKYGNCLQYKSFEKSVNGKAKTVTIYGGANYIKAYLKGKHKSKNVNDIEQYIEYIEDDVFDVLKNSSEEQSKGKGKYTILKIVDDLASGQFRTGGGSKRNMYLFAMVYGMTYYSGADCEEIPDARTDIEMNLFRDYYINNLIRFISQSYEKSLSNFDEPSGQGINYKNFAEVIYLYFISKSNYTPQEKIQLSDEMINRVKISKGLNEVKIRQVDLPNKLDTAFYKGLIKKDRSYDLFSEDILSMPEKEFEEFVVSNYNCNTFVGNTDISTMQVGTEQNTAFKEYSKIIEKLEKLGKQFKDLNYGLWITDMGVFKKKQCKNICDSNMVLDREKFKKFIDLLLGINHFMCRDHEESKNSITRTSLVAIYYYYFNAFHEQDAITVRKSFDLVFSDFKTGIDQYLNAAGYQPLSSKNIFDVVVAFSAYAYMNV